MKSLTTAIISSLIGAGIGFGIGFYIGKKRETDRCDREINAMNKYYKEKYGLAKVDEARKRLLMTEHEPAEKTTEKPAEAAVKMQKDLSKFKTFDQITPVKAPITEYTKKYHTTIERKEDDDLGEHIVPDEDMAEIEEEARMAAEYTCMAIITPEEWEQDDEYTKTELTYWEQDEAFTDIEGTPIPFEIMSPDDVGRANLEKFGITGEEGVLYVRDDANQDDYKIYLEEGSYAAQER